MSPYSFQPIANGMRTDHPIPDLPFADDSHIPIDDPLAIEATGRCPGRDTWGRYYPALRDHLALPGDSAADNGWAAYTTDPLRHDLAWVVRWHPRYGRSVALYPDDDAAAVCLELRKGPLLWRAGGYWWDGLTWYRPVQTWNDVSNVPDPVTVSASDIPIDADSPAGQPLNVADLDPERSYANQWAAHLSS